MNNNLKRYIKKIYSLLHKKLTNLYDPKMSYSSKQKHVDDFTKSREFKRFKISKSKLLTNTSLNSNKKYWKNVFDNLKQKKLIKINYSNFTHDIKIEEYNLFLEFISGIPRKILEQNKFRYIEKLQNKVLNGKIGRKSFEKYIEKLGIKNAKVIARTETSRLQTNILEKRARKLDSVAYKWVSNHDVRTRKSHRDMIDVIVFWSNKNEDKPHLDNMYGNAGEFPNCRCFTSPIFDEYDLPKGAMLKVYNNKSGKIIKMKRRDVIKKIKGE